MLKYNMFEAKQNFSKIIKAVTTNNETCIINKANKQVAKITPINQIAARKIGLMKGKIKVADDFDEPLPENIIGLFEGK
jgi:antitoxin (DNA-binding transcriptional repressor) of toxin-antitoxin stability system